ncbi:MAG: hypothetical protein DME26_09805 [Verrucomicrobia bacterium]|nr:MAG: hypothetical protein DME26_09805 [Verrucomicrobiota bacterium]
MYALDGLGALSLRHVAKALTDPDDAVREQGLRLSENFFPYQASSTSELWRQLTVLVSDSSPRVRYQLAFTLGEIHQPALIKPLADLAAHDIESSTMQAAILSSLSDAGVRTARSRANNEAALANGAQVNETRGQAVRAPSAAGELFDAVSTLPRIRDGKAGQDFLRQLASIIGAQNRPAEITKLLVYLETVAQPQVAAMVVSGLGNGLQRAGSSLVKADTEGRLQKILAQAAVTAADEQKSETTRAQAAHLLAWADFSRAKPALAPLLDSRQPQAVQLAALITLARFSDPDIGPELVKHWATFTPRVRDEAMSALLARPERVAALLSAIEAETIRAADLSSTQSAFLREHRNRALRQRALKVLGNPKPSEREQVVQSFLPALQLTGVVARGHEIYQNRCASCHRVGSEGHALGPDLATVKSSGKEKMLVNILDPNREVAPNYLNYLVETKDGETWLGIISGETGTSLTLRQPNGVEQIVLRSNITRTQSQGQSAMPEGLEAGLSHQDLADLLEFLMTQK